VLPVLWSMPTALMIGELASAIPADGGFYVWVRRALGPFWGYQEGWLSLSASIFDMALYPTIFVLYLGRFAPSLTAGFWLYNREVPLFVAAHGGFAPFLRSDGTASWFAGFIIGAYVPFIDFN